VSKILVFCVLLFHVTWSVHVQKILANFQSCELTVLITRVLHHTRLYVYIFFFCAFQNSTS